MTITLSQAEFFKNGSGGVSKVVGVESGVNRVARYRFTAPATGASSVRLSFSGMWPGNGKKPTEFRFYIGTDPDSHVKAGEADPCTGLLTGSNTDFIGAADMLLLPDTEYYLFVFPNTTTFGWYNWEGSGVLTTDGGSYSQPELSTQRALLGESLTVLTNPHSAEFTHRLTYRLGEAEGLIAEGVGESAQWTPPLELAEQMPDAEKAICTVFCETYQQDRLLGTAQVTLTLCVPDFVLPTVSATWVDPTGASDLLGQPVQRLSTLEVTVSGQGISGSTIVSRSVSLNGRPYTGGTLMTAGTQTLTVFVTDSRGRTGQAEYTIEVAAYDPPELTLSAHRCREDGTADDTGEFCLVTVTGRVHDLGGRNSASLTPSFAQAQAVEGVFERTYLISAPSTATLPLQVTLTDALSTASRDMVLSVGYATMDLLRGGRGIAFGTTATREGFTCAMDARFLGSDLALADYVVESGSEGIWHYRKWNSGMAECWGKTQFTITTTASDTVYQGVTDAILFPSGLFVDVPIPTWSHYGNAYINSNVSWLSKDGCGFLCNTVWPLTDTVIECWMQVRGTWK